MIIFCKHLKNISFYFIFKFYESTIFYKVIHSWFFRYTILQHQSIQISSLPFFHFAHLKGTQEQHIFEVSDISLNFLFSYMYKIYLYTCIKICFQGRQFRGLDCMPCLCDIPTFLPGIHHTTPWLHSWMVFGRSPEPLNLGWILRS